MPSNILQVLGKVISSWQVIVVTIALLIYLKLIFYVAHPHYSRHSDFSFNSKPGKKKKERPVKTKETFSDNDDLGLVEED
jgi:hypothetical protein